MSESSPVCLTFAGVVGSSKTPIATYLSWQLGWPIYNNDTVRTEVIEDFGHFDDSEYRQRRDQRLEAIITKNISFICDASVDREWVHVRPRLKSQGYRWYIISLDLSQKLLKQLYAAKGYSETLPRLDQLLKEHDQFLNEFAADISLHISDELFPQRLKLSLEAVRGWLDV